MSEIERMARCIDQPVSPAFQSLPVPGCSRRRCSWRRAGEAPHVCRAKPDAENESLPGDYTVMAAQITAAVKRALAAGCRLQEIQFPPLARMDTAALNQVLDANRGFAREFTRAFSAQLGGDLRIAMPDASEAKLARKLWGETPFSVSSIGQGADPQDKMVVCVNPGGFNVNEWLQIEKCDVSTDSSIVLLNADLDKVRSGYYPRIFYPRLFEFKNRYLSQFETTYYIRPFYAGGTLFRCYPGDWQILARTSNGSLELIHSQPTRPSLSETEQRLRSYTATKPSE